MQDGRLRRSNADRREETRKALLNAARMLFVEKGYADTGTPEIVKAAAVTRGALYHHFADKADLLRAVLQLEAETVAHEIEQNTATTQMPLDAFLIGARAYFQAMKVPGRAQLLLIEGPGVLGTAEMSELDRKSGGVTLLAGLKQSVTHGLLKDAPLEALSDLLSATFDRAAFAISKGEAEHEYVEAITLILKGLLKPTHG